MASLLLPPPSSPTQPNGPVRDRKPIVAIAVVSFIGLVAVGALVAVLLGGGESPPERSPVVANAAPTHRLTATDDGDPSELAPEGVHFDLSTTLTIDVTDTASRRHGGSSVLATSSLTSTARRCRWRSLSHSSSDSTSKADLTRSSSWPPTGPARSSTSSTCSSR